MKHLYIVRHCQAEGQSAAAKLTDAGRQQADQLAEFLSDKHIDHIVASPYERAYRSITPLAQKLGLKVVLDDRLTERVLCSENRPDWRDMLQRTYDDLDLCYEGGESSNTAMRRAVSVMMEVLNRDHKNAVIVSHGNLMSLMLKHFDHRIGFSEWEAMSNPDVYRIAFIDDATSIERMWRE